MKIAIIGAGFTGLSAAHQLQKRGHAVTIFEKDTKPGGLAIGYKEKDWEWSLEKHYHHWFTNDKNILDLAHELSYPVLIKRPKTSVYYQNNFYQLDSPQSVLGFPKLPLIDKIRMAAILGLLRYNPFWKSLENIHAATFLEKTMGKKAYNALWKPQLKNKFGSYINQISLAWFWARIVKRTPNLAYPEKGFLPFAQTLAETISTNKGEIFYDTEILSIKSDTKPEVVYKKGHEKEKKETFDKIIVTVSAGLFLKIAKDLPTPYTGKLRQLKSLGAINLVLRLSKPFFPDNTYWLSVCDTNAPLVAIVEHTNFMDKKHYNNEHLVYLGNYLPANHEYFAYDKKKLLDIYDPFLKKINKDYKKSLIGSALFKVPFAQPIIPVNYSKIIPPFTTPLKDVYLANMQQVYPWDRGTNYAVELGEKIAKIIQEL